MTMVGKNSKILDQYLITMVYRDSSKYIPYVEVVLADDLITLGGTPNS